MSKTLGSIITFAGAIVVNVVPGLGQIASAAILVGSAALGAIISGLDKGAQANTLTTTAIKTERPPRVSAYGRLKLFGAYILYEANDAGYAVDVWAFHDGRIDAIEGWYLADKPVVRLANGLVQKGADGSYGNNDVIQIGANLGAATETAHAAVMAALPGIWTADHRGDGVVTGYMVSKPIKAQYYQEVYPSGGPNQLPLALVMRAQPVFDWRDPTQSLDNPLSWKWSENVWLHIAHYQLVRNGKTWARHFAPTLAYWTAAANDADSPMPLKAGGTEPRYRSCVSHRHAGEGSEPKAVLGALIACCDGWMAPRADGALVVYSGRYYPPTVTIGPDVIVAYTVEDGIEDENAKNYLNVTYVSAAHDYNEVDTDPWTDEDDIAARGALRSDDLKNQVPSHAQGRRLAKRRMAQIMAPKRGTVAVTSDGEALLSERYVRLRLIEGEGTPGEFAPFIGVAEITDLRRNLQTGGLVASWIKADPNIDAWNPATEEGDAAPVGERVARQPLEQPSIISATAQYSAVGTNPGNIADPGGSNSTGARILIAANGPIRDDLTWYGRWRVGASGSWSERDYPDADPGPGVSFLTEFVPITSSIQVEVAYSTGDGRLSPWSEFVEVDTTGG